MLPSADVCESSARCDLVSDKNEAFYAQPIPDRQDPCEKYCASCFEYDHATWGDFCYSCDDWGHPDCLVAAWEEEEADRLEVHSKLGRQPMKGALEIISRQVEVSVSDYVCSNSFLVEEGCLKVPIGEQPTDVHEHCGSC